ncbi:hypothetical protein [Leptospira stimsonii]|uniref:Uncharacterized protein n=1 Tax=Leptospira stimsonii TaxID=2202203 RepID=A0ABY2N354_9LEPT|nr:hypothetical protein [Leptospira stimsonii]TGK20250.1 hypothetical protein EHO98_09920 [Leptospira stimsonii]TGM14893.1 hypothetical protein EHQ90_10445 [Leptospira stimsonii]
MDENEILRLSFEKLTGYSYVNCQIEFYELNADEEPFKLKPAISFYSTYSLDESIIVRSESKSKIYYGKIIVGGTNILPFLYGKVFHRTIFFGFDLTEDKTKLIKSNIENECINKTNVSVCPKIDASKRFVIISMNKELDTQKVDYSKSLSQWLMIGLSYATLKVPIPLIGFVSFRENVEISYQEILK